MKTLGIANPKGGCGKTTTAVTLSALASEQWRTLLVDSDETHSAAEWSERAGDAAHWTVAHAAGDTESLSQVRIVKGFDLAIVDLPGARGTGELAAILRSPGARKPAVDALLMPSQPSALDLRVLVRTIVEEVRPARVPYLVLLTLVGTHPGTIGRAATLADELRSESIPVAASVICRRSAHQSAANYGVPITQLPGKPARVAEYEYRSVAREIFDMVGLAWKDERK